MTLVAGVDSSTQSCKVVVRDADHGRARSHRVGTTPGLDRGRSGALVGGASDGACGRRRPRRLSSRLDCRATARHDLPRRGRRRSYVLRCCGTTLRSGPGGRGTRRRTRRRRVGARRRKRPGGGLHRQPSSDGSPSTNRKTLDAPQPSVFPTTGSPGGLLGSSRRHGPTIESLTTDRSDASGTGYWSPITSEYRFDLLKRAFGRVVAVPSVLGPAESPGERGSVVLGPGAGDNAAAALVIGPTDGDVIVSVGTSGTVFASSDVLDARQLRDSRRIRRRDGALPAPRLHPERCPCPRGGGSDSGRRPAGLCPDLALSAPPGADGLVLLPYLEGERTPNLPDSTGELHGLSQKTSTPAHLARAAVEGLLCGLADALDAVEARGVQVERVHLIGGGSRSEALRQIAPSDLRPSGARASSG